MTDNIYKPTTLTKAIKRIENKNTGLLGLVFKRQAEHLTETISTDIDENLPEIAPLISDVEEGVVLKDKGFITKTITPAFIRIKKEINRAKALTRQVGQPIGQGKDNTIALKARALKQAKESAMLRLKVMAVQALFDGEINYSDNEGRTYNLDFQRDTRLNTTLIGVDSWTNTSVDITEQLEAWAGEIRAASGSNPNLLILDPKAWSKFRNNEKIRKNLDLRRGTESKIELACNTTGNVIFVGSYGSVDIAVYSEQYTENGVSKPMLAENSAILLNIEDVVGVRHFGSLMTKKGLIQTDFLAKELYKEETSKLWAQLESRPILVPHRINATFACQVA